MAHSPGDRLKLPFLRKRLSTEAFAELMAQSLAGRWPGLDVRVSEMLTLRMGTRETGTRRVHLDRAYEQYQRNPDSLSDVVARWTTTILEDARLTQKLDLSAVVPAIKTHRWLEAQRAQHQREHGDTTPFDMCWQRYNNELIIVYVEFTTTLNFLGAHDVDASGLSLQALGHLSLQNLRYRLRELKVQGGANQILTLTVDGNLEPSLILLDEVWLEPRTRVEGSRLIAIAERGAVVTAGSANAQHVWWLAADATAAFRKAQYPVSPYVFEWRGGRFEVLDEGAEDATHPLARLDRLDVHAVKRGGGSDLGLVVTQPLRSDARSVYRLFQKVEHYLNFIASEDYFRQYGIPTSSTTRIVVSIHPKSDRAIFELLDSLTEWIKVRNVSLVVSLRE